MTFKMNYSNSVTVLLLAKSYIFTLQVTEALTVPRQTKMKVVFNRGIYYKL
jgi:hypothetical protein